jgi:hypothetical protein
MALNRYCDQLLKALITAANFVLACVRRTRESDATYSHES